jgi:hypothetical protein
VNKTKKFLLSGEGALTMSKGTGNTWCVRCPKKAVCGEQEAEAMGTGEMQVTSGGRSFAMEDQGVFPQRAKSGLVRALVCIWCFETGSHYITQADLELTVLLPQLSESWDYRHA